MHITEDLLRGVQTGSYPLRQTTVEILAPLGGEKGKLLDMQDLERRKTVFRYMEGMKKCL